MRTRKVRELPRATWAESLEWLGSDAWLDQARPRLVDMWLRREAGLKPSDPEGTARKGDQRSMSAAFARALDAGGTMKSACTVEWDVAGRCQSPRYAQWRIKGQPRVVDMTVPCRKCDVCLRKRAHLWKSRAQWELRQAPRTWMISLTLSPENHYKMLLHALKRARLGAVDFEKLPQSEQLLRRHREIGVLLTRWLKRVRKASGSRFRYFLVLEAHESGLPHYHALLHEISGQRQITKRDIQSQWPYGFSNAKLAYDQGGAGYVCKYISKSSLARVRASGRYGADDPQPTASSHRQSREQSDPPNSQ